MAISLPSGFRITVQEPVDNRLTLTKQEMINVVDANMPTNYLCVCKDDGKLYIYNANNSATAETGKFRLFEGGITYQAGSNVQINGNVISATDTKYTAGQNITIDSNNVISATGGGKVYAAGNGINIDNDTISTKLGNGLKHTEDGKITIQPADRSLSVGEFGVHVPVITTSLDVTDNGLAVKLADNSIVAYNSGTGTKGLKVNTDVIQSKLTAGQNITIDNNVISATGGGEPSAYLKGANVDGNKLELEKKDGTKVTYNPDFQAKLTAGEHISISDQNVISADLSNYATLADLEIGKEITVGQTVGGITAGTVYPATTKMAKILEDLLSGTGPAPTGITIYYGSNTQVPTGIAGLTSKSIAAGSVIGDQNQNILCDDEDNGKYPIYAVPVGYKISKWVAASAPSFPLGIKKVVADNYNIYYVDSLVYDAPDGTDYIITIAQEG